MRFFKGLKNLDRLFQEEDCISGQQIYRHVKPRWFATLTIFLLKRSNEFDYSYTWIHKPGHYRLFTDYRYQVPKDYRKQADIIFTRKL